MASGPNAKPVLAGIDRLVLRVPGVPAAVAYYRDTLGLTIAQEGPTVATVALPDGREILLHSSDELPAEGVFLLVDDVRDVYARRESLRLRFKRPPIKGARGWRAECRDPFDTPLLLIDRALREAPAEAGETLGGGTTLFPGVETHEAIRPKPEALAAIYEQVGRTADDLPHTPQFERLHQAYVQHFEGRAPDHRETWRHLLSLRKAGKLPRLGAAREAPPADEAAQRLVRELVDELFDGKIGRRDRLPYSPEFERLRDVFNARRVRERRPVVAPHALWRIVASVAK